MRESEHIDSDQVVLNGLARVKVLFQQRALAAVLRGPVVAGHHGLNHVAVAFASSSGNETHVSEAVVA